MESAGHDPTVAGPAFMASLDALVAASTTGGGAIDEDALRYCLETLDGRIAELKDDVFATVKGHWSVFQASFRCVDQLGDKVATLRRVLLQLVKALRSQGRESAQANAVQLALKHQRMTAELDGHSRLVALLEVLSQVHEGFLDFDKALEAGRYREAAQGLATLQRLVSRLPRAPSTDRPGGDREDDAQIVMAVRQQLVRKRARLRSRLEQLAAEALVVTPDGVLRVTTELAGTYGHLHYDNRTSLTELLSALNVAGLLDSHLTSFSRLLMDYVIVPVLDRNVVPRHDERQSSATLQVLQCVQAAGTSGAAAGAAGAASGPGASGKGNASPTRRQATGGGAKVESLFDRLLVVVQFLQSHVFHEQPDLFCVLGTKLWNGDDEAGTGASNAQPGIARRLLQLLQDALPDDASVMRGFHPVLEAAEAFELQLYNRRLLADGERVLASFAEDADAHFAYKKRRQVLANARRLLTSEYHNSVPVVDSAETGSLGALPVATTPAGAAASSGGQAGAGGGGTAGAGTGAGAGAGSGKPTIEDVDDEGLYFFRLPNCQVSTSAAGLVRLAHRTMEQACKATTPRCANVLYHTARDALDMFRAVVPCRFSDSLAAVPRLAMLLHNDCMYISHHLMTIGHQYRHKLPPPLNRTASMVDLAAAFRLMAEQSFVAHMKRQRDQLLDFVASTPEFDKLGEDEAFAQVEHALKAQLYHLTQLSGSWGDILPSHIYHRAMGHLIDAVLEHFLARAQALDDIPETVAHQLHYLLSLLFESERVFAASTVDLPSHLDRGASAGGAQRAAPDAPASTAPPVARLCRLWDKAQQLAVLLDQPLVVLQQRHGAGAFSAFTNAEVASMIRAVFEPSPTMRSFLAALES